MLSCMFCGHLYGKSQIQWRLHADLVNGSISRKKKPTTKIQPHFLWFPDFLPSGIPKSSKYELLNQHFVCSDVIRVIQRTRIPFCCRFRGFRICFHYSEEWKQPPQTFLQMEIVMKRLCQDIKLDLFSSSSFSSGHKWQGNPRPKLSQDMFVKTDMLIQHFGFDEVTYFISLKIFWPAPDVIDSFKLRKWFIVRVWITQ